MRMTPLSATEAPAPGDAPGGVTVCTATADNGLRFTVENVDGSTVHYWLCRQEPEGKVWLKTSYGGTVAGAGDELMVHLKPDQVIPGEKWIVITDRGTPSNDLVYLTPIGRDVDLSQYRY